MLKIDKIYPSSICQTMVAIMSADKIKLAKLPLFTSNLIPF